MSPPRFIRAILFALSLGFVTSSSPAEIILTNFSTARPIKIMPIGDSITDDCVYNGAWRLYLQPLLQSAGYPFTFVGRQHSSAQSPSFTKVAHEGYCGSVIAAPGVFAVYQYSTTNAYLLKIVADALSVPANTPDVIMLLIGANDIGRGRNPWHVATNDMPALLDLIFSKAPNANVIVCKPTSLQNATLSGTLYANNATNVPIYGAALQAVVNQRRTAGQNVSVADMFSVVDYNTMFNSDHVHPNATGLRTMANEWLTRLQMITAISNTAVTSLIHGGDTWKYDDSGEDPGTNWAQPTFDDTTWAQGTARLGYGDPTVETGVNFGPDPTNKFVTTYFRKSFVVPWNLTVTNLNLRVARTGGVVVWLNGNEIYRASLPSGPITTTNLALSAVTGFAAHVFSPVNVLNPGLATGTNLLAIELHQSAVTNPTLGFDLEAIASGLLSPPPTLSILEEGASVALSWPTNNAPGFTLVSSSALGSNVVWSAVTSAAATNAGQNVVTQSAGGTAQFFRLQRSGSN